MGLLGVFCIFLFISAAFLALSLPVYTDESLWKIFGSRLFLDGGKLIYGFPECTAGFLLKPPMTWWPQKLLEAFIYQDLSNPIKHRYLGILGCFMFLGVLVFGFKKLFTLPGFVVAAIVISVFSLATLPFLIMLNRPEQSILTYILVCILLPFFTEKISVKASNLRFNLSISFVYFLIVIFAFATHPKSQFFILIFLASHWLVLRGPRKIVYSFPFTISVGLAALETTRFWQTRTNCLESPWLTNVLSNLTLRPELAFKNPVEFFKIGLSNWASIHEYFANIMYQLHYQGDWIPNINSIPTSFENFLNFLLYVPIAFMAIMTLKNLTLWFMNRPADNRGFYLTLALILSLAFITFFQKNRNFYESGLVIPMVVIIWLSSMRIFIENRPSHFRNFGYLALLLCACLQLFYFNSHFFGTAHDQWQATNHKLEKWRGDVANLAFNQCGLSRTESLGNLILDEKTYPVFWNSYAPMFAHAVFGWWGTGVDYKKVLQARHVNGIVTLCKDLPEEIRSISVTDGNFCCLKDPIIRLHLEMASP